MGLNRTNTRHKAFAWFVAATLMLTVFSWGLHYKLSLYEAASVQHAAPEAKVLSQRERPVSVTHFDGPLANAPSLAKQVLPHAVAALPKASHALSLSVASSTDSPQASAMLHSAADRSAPRAPPVLI